MSIQQVLRGASEVWDGIRRRKRQRQRWAMVSPRAVEEVTNTGDLPKSNRLLYSERQFISINGSRGACHPYHDVEKI